MPLKGEAVHFVDPAIGFTDGGRVLLTRRRKRGCYAVINAEYRPKTPVHD
jgi:hypothetical protein